MTPLHELSEIELELLKFNAFKLKERLIYEFGNAEHTWGDLKFLWFQKSA